MSLGTILLLHVVANLACWLRWSFVPHKQGVLGWITIGIMAGWIPMWPDSMAACWFLTVLSALLNTWWVVFNFKAAGDSCLDKTVHYHIADELKRYAPGSE